MNLASATDSSTVSGKKHKGMRLAPSEPPADTYRITKPYWRFCFIKEIKNIGRDCNKNKKRTAVGYLRQQSFFADGT